MRKLGVLFAFMFLAAAHVADAQEPFPDPPAPILVNTPSGAAVPVTLPAPTVPAQPYAATAQPITIPVPINLYVTPSYAQRPAPVYAPAPVAVPQPAPFFPAQPPQPAANQSCVPIDGRGPLPFDVPMDGPITSTVLRPPGYMASFDPQQNNPFQQYPGDPVMTQPQMGQFPQQGMPYPGFAQTQVPVGQPYFAPAPAPEQLSVPAPGVPYSLDAQGRPHYVQQPGGYQFPGPQQWPGYTPVSYSQQPGYQPQPGFQQQQPGFQQQLGYQTGQPYPAPAPVDPMQAQGMQYVPPELNPTINPNLTNPNTPVQLVTPAQVQQAIRENAQMVVLDVRGELVRDVIGHLPNDVHVPLSPSESFPARVRQAVPNQGLPVVVYCNDGINSSQAANMLANMGYRAFLMGIYTGWSGHIPAQACTSCL